MNRAQTVELVNALRNLRLTTSEIAHHTGIDVEVIRTIPYPPDVGGVVSVRTDPATLHPGPNAGRDPAFVRAEALLDSPRTGRACMWLCYGVLWALLLFMFAVFCDVQGWGRYIYG